MKVTLKKLILNYFKGVKSGEFEFNPEENHVHGQNESGKTTLFDALWYLFFGKDSQERSDFSIKTFDKENNVIEKVDHSVEGTFEIDGSEKSFERILKEKWNKKTNELSGHVSEFQIDKYPIATKGEYDQVVSDLFSEEEFKLLSNPLYLYSSKMKMADRRRIVSTLASKVDNEMILDRLETDHPGQKKHIQELRSILNIQKDLEAIKLKNLRDKKALREEKDGIPGRIDENLRKIESLEEDWEAIEVRIQEAKEEYNKLEGQILDSFKRSKAVNQKKIKLQDEIYILQKRQNLLKREAEAKAEELNAESGKDIEEAEQIKNNLEKKLKLEQENKETLSTRVQGGKKSIQEAKDDIASYEAERKKLKEKFEEVKAKQFKVSGDCPYCGTDLETVERFSAAKEGEFKKEQKEELFSIIQKGNTLKGKIESKEEDIKKYTLGLNNLEAHLKEAVSEIDSISGEINTLNDFIIESSSKESKEQAKWEDHIDPQYEAISVQIEAIEKDIKTMDNQSTSEGLEAIKREKARVQDELHSLDKKLAQKEQLTGINTRVEELKAREKELAIKITNIEGLENTILNFSMASMNQMENEINEKFSLISWKMFDRQINGETKEICEAIYKGVPFSDLNTAGKIQAGIDIINAFSKEYDLYLPVFIDNRESVTEIPECLSQVINLVVNPICKKLILNPSNNELVELMEEERPLRSIEDGEENEDVYKLMELIKKLTINRS